MGHGNSEAQGDSWEIDVVLQTFEMERTCAVGSDSFELNARLLVWWG
jgi:acyl transferase domain-containing protein